MTNGDKIRQMNNEELIKFLEEFTYSTCPYCVFKFRDTNCINTNCYDAVFKWLESEAGK